MSLRTRPDVDLETVGLSPLTIATIRDSLGWYRQTPGWAAAIGDIRRALAEIDGDLLRLRDHAGDDELSELDLLGDAAAATADDCDAESFEAARDALEVVEGAPAGELIPAWHTATRGFHAARALLTSALDAIVENAIVDRADLDAVAVALDITQIELEERYREACLEAKRRRDEPPRSGTPKKGA